MTNTDKHLLGYPTFKEAKRAAIEYSAQHKNWTCIVPIYQERDGSFTLRPTNGKSQLVIAVDKSGQEYVLTKKTDDTGKTSSFFEKHNRKSGVQK